MAFFDIFKKKKQAPPSEEQLREEQEELSAGLEKTKSGLFSKIARAVAGRSSVDADVLDDLEEGLITSRSGAKSEVCAPPDRAEALRAKLLEQEIAGFVRSLRQSGLEKEAALELLDRLWAREGGEGPPPSPVPPPAARRPGREYDEPRHDEHDRRAHRGRKIRVHALDAHLRQYRSQSREERGT